MLALGPPAQPVARRCRTARLGAYTDGTGTTNVTVAVGLSAAMRGLIAARTAVMAAVAAIDANMRRMARASADWSRRASPA
jgi:hypothetical protein